MNSMPSAIIDPAQEDRICPKCGKTKPASNFASINSSQCKNCARRGHLVGQNQRLKNALAALATRQIVASARGDRIDAPRISQVCAEMVRLFGGTEKFCKRWHEQIEQAIENNPGGKNALDQLRAIAKLIKDSTSSVDSANPLAGFTEEEIDSEIEIAISRIVTDQIESDGSEDLETQDIDDAIHADEY